jgi:hypothetical protein
VHSAKCASLRARKNLPSSETAKVSPDLPRVTNPPSRGIGCGLWRKSVNPVSALTMGVRRATVRAPAAGATTVSMARSCAGLLATRSIPFCRRFHRASLRNLPSVAVSARVDGKKPEVARSTQLVVTSARAMARTLIRLPMS